MTLFSEFRKTTYPIFLAEAKGNKKIALAKTKSAFQVMGKVPSKKSRSRVKRMNGYDRILRSEDASSEMNVEEVENIGKDEFNECLQTLCALRNLHEKLRHTPLIAERWALLDIYRNWINEYIEIIAEFAKFPSLTSDERLYLLNPLELVESKEQAVEYEEKILAKIARSPRAFDNLIAIKLAEEFHIDQLEETWQANDPQRFEAYEQIKFDSGEGCVDRTHWEMVRDDWNLSGDLQEIFENSL